jgi:N-acetylmuramoyl-L-alanine amidase
MRNWNVIDWSVVRRAAWGLVGLAAVWLSGCAGFESAGGVGNFDTVIVDAGHGGHDRGARAVSGGNEKVLALDTSRRLARALRARGFRVIETRTGDYFVPLDARVNAANRTPGSIFVSVHYNWARRKGAQGIEIFYYSPRSRPLAANILQRTLGAFRTENRGVKRNGFYVLRNARRPAVLCELGFLSNSHDNRFAQNPAVRQRLADRIADGIAASRQ